MRNKLTLGLLALSACLTLSISAAMPATTKSPLISDQQLGSKISDKLESGWFSEGYPGVKARIENGNVTLTGTVNSARDKEKLDKEIRNIEGVNSVDSQLQVVDRKDRDYDKNFSRDTFKTPQDEQLNKKIREKVSEGWLWDSYKDVILNTDNGVITLSGSVKNSEAQNKLIKEIGKIEGVKSVKSTMILRDK